MSRRVVDTVIAEVLPAGKVEAVRGHVRMHLRQHRDHRIGIAHRGIDRARMAQVGLHRQALSGRRGSGKARVLALVAEKRGGGAIVMIASIWGRESGGRMTYNAVKAAEISLAKAMAQQLARDNIRVNSVSPGSILFEGGSWWKRQQSDPTGIADMIKRDLPFGRFGRAEEVGAVVAFLASCLGECGEDRIEAPSGSAPRFVPSTKA